MTNIFRQAAELLKAKDKGTELTEEELWLVNTAIIPLMTLPEYNNVPISEGLETLTKIVEEAGGKP